ncbi:MAG: CoA transferase [Actinobacteria bacterium]|nr:CoA transferase [Actinomycetota bacterium]
MNGGALEGIKVIELGALGPAPFCAMVLADHGADVLRVERPNKSSDPNIGTTAQFAAWDILSRGRRSVGVDLKNREGRELIVRLAEDADVLIEGFRPGVAERLGLGPDELRGVNPRLIYGRMTGWGRRGPLAERAGHDINYLAVSGVQAHIGRAGQPPTPPLNVVGDFGGGGMLLAFGICAALVSRGVSGEGQVVDAAMIDGASLLMAPLAGAHAMGFWSDERGTNLLDSGAPFYDCYECRDGGYVSVGAIEAPFFAELMSGLGLDGDGTLDDPLGAQNDRNRWPELRDAIAQRFLTRTRDEWAAHFADRDACVSPVLTMGEAPAHPHNAAWGGWIDVGGVVQPAPAPRFSGTPAPTPSVPEAPAASTDAALAAWGVSADELAALRTAGAIGAR